MIGKKFIAFTSVILALAILVVLNFLVGHIGVANPKLDLTEKKLYTLSEGTQEILQSIPNNRTITLRYYDTQDSRVMPTDLDVHARNVRDLLKEFVNASNGRVILEEFHPVTDNEDEDRAHDDEIQPIPISASDNVYLGVSIQSLQKKEVIPFLNPSEETRLEYELARSIRNVLTDKRPLVGVMSSFPVGGPPFAMPGQPPIPPWVFYQILQRDYEVKTVEESIDKIDPEISVLILVHPAGFSERTEYAIDQYLLHGGNVVVFADAHSFVAEQGAGSRGAVPLTSTLPKLFPNWGITVQPEQILVDQKYAANFGPSAPSLPIEAMNDTDNVTANLENVLFPLAGSITLRNAKELQHTILMKSSPISAMMSGESVMNQLRTQGDFSNFIADNKEKPLVVRVTGTFHTAFPNGRPPAPPPPTQSQDLPGGFPPGFTIPGLDESGGAAPNEPTSAPPPLLQRPDTTPPPEAELAIPELQTTAPPETQTATPPEPPDPDFIAAAKNDKSQVIIIADSDLLADNFCAQQVMGGFMLPNNNIPFLGNLVEQLSGGSMLATVRSRASAVRPFTYIQQREAEIRESYSPRLAQINQQIQETQQNIGNFNIKAEDGQIKMILTPAQEKQMQELRDKLKLAEKQERDLKKEQRSQVDALKNYIKTLNVFGIPLLVVSLGALIYTFRSFSIRAR